MRTLRSRLVVLLAVGLAAVGLVIPSATAATLPVSYDFLVSAVAAGANVYADPPGANDWACKPSAAHPEPVVLVHGLLGNKNTNWQTYAPLLANNGYCVYSLTYGVPAGQGLPLDQFGGRDLIETSAHELGAFVAKVLAATGASKVDIVGHSEGTVMPDYYAKVLGGARYIDKYVSLAALWHGSSATPGTMVAVAAQAYGLGPVVDAVCGACFEFAAGSPFYQAIDAGTGSPVVPGITYTNIVTKYDELVKPYTSGIQAGMTNFVVQDQCPTDYTEHFEMASDPVAAADVLNALDPAHPRPVPCTLVLPFIGTGL